MKNFKTHLRALLCLLLATLLLMSSIACKPQGPDTPEDPNDPDQIPEEELIELIQNGEMTYTVVRPDGASTDLRSTAVRLCSAIKQKTSPSATTTSIAATPCLPTRWKFWSVRPIVRKALTRTLSLTKISTSSRLPITAWSSSATTMPRPTRLSAIS